LPIIDLFHLQKNGKDFIFLSGDAQPTTPQSSYSFTNLLLDFLEQIGCKEIITLGGVGLPEEPKKPSVYVAGNSKKFMSEFKSFGVKLNSFGIVGPIIGVSGLLVGLAKDRKIPAVALLCESYSHPLYVGIRESKVLLTVINKKYRLNIDYSFLDEEINSVEREVSSLISQGEKISKKKSKSKKKSPRVAKLLNNETSYIG
jgi:proteasome assembly chaperone (PAC2) family protein